MLCILLRTTKNILRIKNILLDTLQQSEKKSRILMLAVLQTTCLINKKISVYKMCCVTLYIYWWHLAVDIFRIILYGDPKSMRISSVQKNKMNLLIPAMDCEIQFELHVAENVIPLLLSDLNYEVRNIELLDGMCIILFLHIFVYFSILASFSIGQGFSFVFVIVSIFSGLVIFQNIDNSNKNQKYINTHQFFFTFRTSRIDS